jgi:transcriptional antiterminator NusG
MPTYAISVDTGKEAHVAHLINRSLELIHPEMETRVYVPKKPVYVHLTVEQARISGCALELQYKPLYPGYIFLESDEVLNLYHLMAKWRYRSWYRLLERGDHGFSTMDEDELAWAKRLEEPPSKAVVRDGKLHIVEGPLKGCDDAVLRVKASRNNVCLEVPFRGRKRHVWVAMEIVEE